MHGQRPLRRLFHQSHLTKISSTLSQGTNLTPIYFNSTGPWRAVTNYCIIQQTGQWTKEESNSAFLHRLWGKLLDKFLECLVSFAVHQEELCTFVTYN